MHVQNFMQNFRCVKTASPETGISTGPIKLDRVSRYP